MGRWRWVGLGMACAVLAGSPPANAAAKHHKLMLMDLPPSKGFDANLMGVVNGFLAKDLRDSGFEVITPADIGSALGFERQKQLLGCSESSCLAEIGGAMGADYIVHGQLAALDRATAITLTLNDTNGQALNQVAEVVKSKEADDLLDAIQKIVPKLVAPVQRSLDLTPRANASAAPAGGLSASAQAQGERSNTTSYVLFGVGGAGLVAAAVFGALSYSAHQAYASDGLAGQQGKLDGDKSTSNTDAAIAWTGLAVGIAGGVLGYAMLDHEDGSAARASP